MSEEKTAALRSTKIEKVSFLSEKLLSHSLSSLFSFFILHAPRPSSSSSDASSSLPSCTNHFAVMLHAAAAANNDFSQRVLDDDAAAFFESY